MTDIPEWLANWQNGDKSKSDKTARPENSRSANRWVRGMPSPNPLGRPKGIVDRRMQIAQGLFENAEAIVDAMVEKALEGDSGAASLILSRVLPSLRAQSERVQFDFDATASISEQMESVLQAVSEGSVSADVAKQILEAVAALQKMRDVEALVAQVKIIEQRLS